MVEKIMYSLLQDAFLEVIVSESQSAIIPTLVSQPIAGSQ